jgi:hypothetical protein
LGTPFHGKQIDPDKLVWAITALAEGLGIRAVARVFETDPHSVLRWLVEAAKHLEAFSRYFLRDLHVEQVQMDELFALLSSVKAGEITETEAIQRLSRSLHWVWVAMDPVCKVILAVDVGDRTLEMAQRLVHPSRHPGAGTRLCPAVSHRWVRRVPEGTRHPLRRVDSTRAPPG